MDTRATARALKTELEVLVQTSEAEGRLMTDDEKTLYDTKFAELEATLEQIKRQDLLAEMNTSFEEPATATIGARAAQPPTEEADADVEVRMGKDRQNERGFDNIGEQLGAIAHAAHPESRNGSIDKRLFFLQERGGNPEGEKRASGASEGVASAGGFLVQSDFSETILSHVYDTGQISSRVTRTPIGPISNGLTMNTVDESSRVNGSRYGGGQAYWTAEGAALTGSKPTFQQQQLRLNKLTALFYATEELLSDQTALASLVQRIMPEEIGFKVEDAIVNGTGAGQPAGFTNSAALVTQAKTSGQTADTITAANVQNMWSRMPGRNRANAVWLINQDAEPSLAAATVGDTPVYLPPLGLTDTPYSRLFNRPVLPVEYCATLGDVNDIMLVDLSQYQMIDKGGVRSDSSIHVRFLYDESTFRWLYRCDGQSMWSSAITPFKGSSTTSPFITLAARA